MKLRRVETKAEIHVQALGDAGWVNLHAIPNLDSFAAQYGVNRDLSSDLLGVLQLGKEGWDKLSTLVNELQEAPLDGAVTLPIQPKSFRDFMLFEQHVIDSSRAYVKKFLPNLWPIVKTYESLTGRPFKKLKPHKLWYEHPIYYLNNHLNFGISGLEIPWPSYTQALDYELELGVFLAKPLIDATPDEVRSAMGGFVVINDVSARDVQKAEMDSGFGPQKAKHFYSTMSSIVVTADEIIPDINTLSGTVNINEKPVSICSSANMQYSLEEAIAFASKDERLHPGELFATGTLPGGSGLENGHWVRPGDTLSLTIDRIGTLTNVIGGRA